jgi:hypothetical protein
MPGYGPCCPGHQQPTSRMVWLVVGQDIRCHMARRAGLAQGHAGAPEAAAGESCAVHLRIRLQQRHEAVDLRMGDFVVVTQARVRSVHQLAEPVGVSHQGS